MFLMLMSMMMLIIMTMMDDLMCMSPFHSERSLACLVRAQSMYQILW